MNIGFIGIGKLGMPCAEEIAKKGHNVFGYDVEAKTSNLVKLNQQLKTRYLVEI